MRVRLDNGQVITLKHFFFCSSHVELLKRMQLEVENIELLATGPNGPCVIPCFRLNLDWEELRILNPLAT